MSWGMIFDSLGRLGSSFSAEVLQTILKEFGILEDIGFCICLLKLTTCNQGKLST